MKTIENVFKEMTAEVPADIKAEVDLSFAIATRLDALIKGKGLSKKEFAEAIGKRPSEITKWLSGQHNFTLRTLAMLSSFFGETSRCNRCASVTNGKSIFQQKWLTAIILSLASLAVQR